LDVAEHHGGGAASTERVPDAMHIEPVVSEHFAARQLTAHAVNEDFAAAAGQAAQAGRLQPLEHRAQGKLGNPGEVMDLRRAEAVNVDLRKMRLDVAQQLFVPLELELRVQPA